LEGDLDLQKNLKLVSITKNKAPKKKAVVVKDARKKLVDGEVLHLITSKGKMELEFVKNAKKKGKLFSSLKNFQL
jgi:hypothetical protein